MVKVERSQPAPVSLAIEAQKASGKYNLPDVVQRLKQDFHNKCYICEMGDLQDPQVEHLLPHMNGKHLKLKFDWDNLFWSCAHCNDVKNNKEYSEGIVDCCKMDPEEVLRFCFEQDCVSVTCLENGSAVVFRTAKLVEDVFGTDSTGMRQIKSDNRMKELRKKMNAFFKGLEAYKPDRTNRVKKRIVQVMLRRESAFAAFKRCYIRERLEEFPELSEFVA